MGFTSQLGYSAGIFQTLSPVILAVFELTPWSVSSIEWRLVFIHHVIIGFIVIIDISQPTYFSMFDFVFPLPEYLLVDFTH